MSLARYTNTYRDSAGNVLPATRVLVRRQDGTSPTIYADSLGLIPFAGAAVTAGPTGAISFYVAQGTYNLLVTLPGGTVSNELDVVIGGIVDSASLADLASKVNAILGAGMVGFGPSLSYAEDTVGGRLKRASITVPSIAAATATALRLVGGEVLQALGRTADGDGGGGNFHVRVSAQAADGGIVFDLGGGLKAFRDGWTVFGFNGQILAAWFGFGQANTDTANATALNAAFAYADSFNGALIVAGMGLFEVARLNDFPANTTFEGQGDARTDPATELRFTHLYGPCFRRKYSNTMIRNMVVGASTARSAATMVTKDNFAGLGLTRDDQNYGIWDEPEDGNFNIQNNRTENVWIARQPNTSKVTCAGGYGGYDLHYGSYTPGCHGWAVDNGTYTGRTDLTSSGVCELLGVPQIIGSAGHAMAVGHPENVANPCVRIMVHAIDAYNNGTDPTLMYSEYVNYIRADNSVFDDGGTNGNDTYGCYDIAGKDTYLLNTRLLGQDTATATSGGVQTAGPHPVIVRATHGTSMRVTRGVVVEGFSLPDAVPSWGYNKAEAVHVETGALQCRVKSYSIDGTYNSPCLNPDVYTEWADVATDTTYASVPKVLTSTLLVGKTVDDDDTPGVRVKALGLVSATREDGPAGILGRNESDGDVTQLRMDGVTLTSENLHPITAVSTTPIAILVLERKGSASVKVTGQWDDAGTIREFSDFLWCSWPTDDAFDGSANVDNYDETNTPDSRAYSMNGALVRLAMGANTYNVQAVATTISAVL